MKQIILTDNDCENSIAEGIMTEDAANEFQSKLNLLCDEYSVPRIKLTMTEFSPMRSGVPFKMTYHPIEP